MHARTTLLGLGVLLLAPAALADLTLPPLVTSMGHAVDPTVHAGLLDVTLYGADPTGAKDSTQAIQSAINDARDYMMTTYLPPGTYLVSDTLVGSEDGSGSGGTFCYQVAGNTGTAMGGEYVAARAPTLVGPPSGPRAVLKLKDTSTGFGSTTSPKPVVHFVDLGPPSQYVNAVVGAFDCLMYSVIRDVDLELGTGNVGAIGIQYYSAQFSYMANVSVNATGAYAGIQGAPATSDWVNLAVTGGQYGIVIDNGGTSSLAGVSVSGQTGAGLMISASGAIAITGFQIAETAATPVVVKAFNGVPQIGGVSLFDGTITQASSVGTAAITNANAVDLVVQNVYVDAAAGLVKSGSQAPVAGSGSTDRIDQYACTDTALTNAPYAPNTSYDLVNGVTSQNGMARTTLNAGPAPTDFVIRHLPGQLPWFTDNGVVDATAMGADATGFMDSTAAIQAAIDASEGKGDLVFLPRGTYLLSGTLKLHPDTHLFGIPGLKATLWASTWSPMAVFTPFVQTADTATGKTFVGDIQLMLPDDDKDGIGYDQSYLYALEWQAGQSSVLFHFVTQLTPQWGSSQPASAARKMIHVANHGGGRWYGLQEGGDPSYCRDKNADFRFLFVDGTTAPLTLYGPNLEHAAGDDFIEVSNASNVRIFESKTECDSTWLAVEGSQNVLLAGLSGDWQPNKVGVLFTNATNVEASNLGWYADESNTTSSYVTSSGGGYPDASVAWANAVSLFQNGTFDESQFPHCGDGFCDGGETLANCPADCTPGDAGGPGDTGGPDDAGGPLADAGAGSDGGLARSDGGGPRDAATAPGEVPGAHPPSSGCACSAGRTAQGPGPLLVLVLAGGAIVRVSRRGKRTR